MTTLTTIEIEPPYLLFIGDMDYELDAKTAFGIAPQATTARQHTDLFGIPTVIKSSA